jgi:hypothetical protein
MAKEMSLTAFVALTVVCWIVAAVLIVLALQKPDSEPGGTIRGRRVGRHPRPTRDKEHAEDC